MFLHGMDELTPQQIENWRKVLVGLIGPYALIMPEKDIQATANSMQERIDSEMPLGASEEPS
jgi:hypothetical protein